MKLATSRSGAAPLAVVGNETLDLSRLRGLEEIRPRSIAQLLAGGGEVLDAVDSAVKRTLDGSDGRKDELREAGILCPLDLRSLGAPFPRPGLLFFTGGNYKAHLDEIAKRTGMKIDPPASPIGFIKNSHTVIGPGDEIVLPASCEDMVDFEVEFSFVVGKPCHDVSEKDAADYIAGYTLVNDVSARNWNASAKRADGSMDLTMPTLGKQFPTFCPMGPVFVTRDEIADPYDVRVKLLLNGNVMQDARTDDLLFGFERILSYFSRFFAFKPGDVITTGSPPGVGFARNPAVFLKPGDSVEVSATGIGAMTNGVVGAADARDSHGVQTHG